MEFNAENLRQITNQSIKVQQEETEKQRLLEIERKRLEEESKINRAKEIINNAIEKAKLAAMSGQNQAHIMKLEKYGREADVHGVNGQNCTRTNLGLTAAYVYDYFEESGFKVSIVYDHDGVGMSDWFNLYISW